MTSKKIEERLNQDEGAWLKMIGEVGDISRLILADRADHKRLEERIAWLADRLAQLEEKLIPLLTKGDTSEANKAN